jgi:tetratricopeptide (TPR) repeat protein
MSFVKQSFLLMLVLLMLTGGSSPLWAVDTIFKSDGKRVDGTITTFSKTEIDVQQGTRTTKVPVNEIERITWNQEPTDLRNARGSELAGNLERALELYEAVKSGTNSLSNTAKTDVDYLIARTKARAALRDKSKADGAIATLQAFKSANANNFRYYELHEFLGKLHAVKGDSAASKAAFDEMGSSPFNDMKMAARIYTADAMLDAGDLAGAQAEYAAVAGMSASTQPEINRRNQARLGQALCLVKQNQGEKAIELCDLVIQDTTPEHRVEQATAFLRKGDALQAAGRNQHALMSYLKVDLLFEDQPPLHAEALFQLTNLWAAVGKPDRASDARARLLSQYTNSEWAEKLQPN